MADNRDLRSADNTSTSQYRWLTYKWKTKSRYYSIHLQTNLLGLWSVIYAWGGITNRLGAYHTEIFDSYIEALEFVNELNDRRRKRKYELMQVF